MSGPSPAPQPAAAPDDSPLELEFKVKREHNGERIDVCIAKSCPQISRTLAQRLLREGAILINGRAVKPSLKVGGGELIQIELPEPEILEATPEDIPLNVLYEDTDIIV